MCRGSSERLERRTGMAEPFLSEIRLTFGK
jgi:hypothetical protein